MSSDEGSTSRPAFINPSYFKHIHRSNKWACTLCADAKKKRKPMTYREAIQHERRSTDHAFLVKAQISRQEQQQQQQQAQPSSWDQPSDPRDSWEAPGPPVEAWFAEDTTFMTKEQLQSKEHQYFADQVNDMIPFWIRGIEAAEQGEVLRLEEFLDSLENETWPPHGPDPWSHGERHSTYGGRASKTWEPTAWENNIAKWIVKSVSSASADSGQTARKAVPTASHDIHSKTASVQDPNSLVEVVARQNAADDNRKREMYSFYELPTNEKVKKIYDLIGTLRSS